MKTIIVFALQFLFLNNLYSQVYNIDWSTHFGGSNEDYPTSLIKDKSYLDGYFIMGTETSNDGDISGHIGAPGSLNIWIVKTDSLGNKIWDKSFGGTSGEYGCRIFQKDNGNIVFTGSTSSIDGHVSGNHVWPQNPLVGTRDFWIVEVDSNLNIIWQKCLGGTEYDEMRDAIQTFDGGYLVIGKTESNDGDVSGFHGDIDYWAVKLDSIGNIDWNVCIGSPLFDDGYSCCQLEDSSFLLAGVSQTAFTNFHGSSDIAIAKISTSGSVIWTKSFGGSGVDQACKVIAGLNETFYVVGTSNSNDGDVHGAMGFSDIWIFKSDLSGNILWDKCYGGSGLDYSFNANKTDNDGIIFTGWSVSNDSIYVVGNHGGYDAWVAEIDSYGNLLWGKSLGGSENDIAKAVLKNEPNSCVLVSSSLSSDGDFNINYGDKDIWLTKLIGAGSNVELNENIKFFGATILENDLIVNFYSSRKKNIPIVITDILGRVIINLSQGANEGLNQLRIPFQNWSGLKVITIDNQRTILY